MAQTTDRSAAALTTITGEVTLRRTVTVYETAWVEVGISVPAGLTDEQITALLAAAAHEQYAEDVAAIGLWDEEDRNELAVQAVEVRIIQALRARTRMEHQA